MHALNACDRFHQDFVCVKRVGVGVKVLCDIYVLVSLDLHIRPIVSVTEETDVHNYAPYFPSTSTDTVLIIYCNSRGN